MIFKNFNPENTENDIIALKLKILNLENLNMNILKHEEKNKHVIKNKIEQNNAMINLLKVMKQEIALLLNCLYRNNLYCDDVSNRFKEFKKDEHKALLFIQKIADEQFSESEAELEGKYFISYRCRNLKLIN